MNKRHPSKDNWLSLLRYVPQFVCLCFKHQGGIKIQYYLLPCKSDMYPFFEKIRKKKREQKKKQGCLPSQTSPSNSPSGSIPSLSLVHSIFIHEIILSVSRSTTPLFHIAGLWYSSHSLQVRKFSDQAKCPFAFDGRRLTGRRWRRRRHYWSPLCSWTA